LITLKKNPETNIVKGIQTIEKVANALNFDPLLKAQIKGVLDILKGDSSVKKYFVNLIKDTDREVLKRLHVISL